MKTNKSLTKRIRVTKNGKMLTRTPGGNHFNAKESRSAQLRRKKGQQITMSNKDKGRYMPKA